MSEKRFKLSKWCGSADTSCILDEQGAMLQGEVVDLLNSLVDENEQLQQQNNELKLILKQHEFAEKEGFKGVIKEYDKSYWKHKVGSLLFILSKFEDKEKVRELIKEVEEEGYSICDK